MKSTSQWVSLQLGGAAPSATKEETKAPANFEGIVWAGLPMLMLTGAGADSGGFDLPYL